MGLPRTIPASVPPVAAQAPRAASSAPRPVVWKAPVGDMVTRPPVPEARPLVSNLYAPVRKVEETLVAATQVDPETSYTGPGSGAIPTLDAREAVLKDVGRDMGAVNPETGEYDVEQADPMEKVLPARIDQKMRDKATGLLQDRSLRDVFSLGDSTRWVSDRQQQLLNNRFSQTPPADEAERSKANDDAYWQAVDELATLATVGYTGGPVPLPLDRKPNSSTWDLLTGKKVELLGKDRDGNVVLRQQNDLGWAVDVLTIPQYLFASTGLPEQGIQAAFGKKAGAPDPSDPAYAKDVLAERRTFSDMARDAAPEGALSKGALYTGAFAADVLFPDLGIVAGKALKGAGKVGEILLKTERGARALDATRTARAVVGATGRADALAHVERVLQAEADAARAVDDTLPVAEKAARLADEAEQVQATASKFSKPMAAELERRALAATSEAVSKAGDDALRVMEQAAEGGAKGTTGLLRGLSRVASAGGDMRAAEAVYHAVKAARVRAAESVRAGLTAPAEAAGKAEGSLRMVADSMVAAPPPTGILGRVAEAIGMGASARGMKAVEQAAREGSLVLEAEDLAELAVRIEKQVGKEAMPQVVKALPRPGAVVTPEQLAHLDDVVGKARRTNRETPTVAQATYDAVRPLGAGQYLPGFAARTAEIMALPLRGADEAAPYAAKGLGRSIRDATIRAQRGIDAVLSDVARLKNEEQAIAYLQGAPVTAPGLVTTGQNHLSLFASATALRMAGAAAVRDAAQSFVQTGRLAELQKSGSSQLDDLADWLVTAMARAPATPEAVADVLLGLKAETARVLGADALSPEGWRRFTAVTAANGQQVVAAEELLGAGAVLSSRDRDAILDTLGAGSTGVRTPTALERAAEEGGIRALQDAEHRADAALQAYLQATTQAERGLAMQAQGYARAAVDEAKKKLAPAPRRSTSLADAERATVVSSRVSPPRAEDLVRANHPPAPLPGIVDAATAARVEQVRSLMDGGYVPSHVREELAKAVGKAAGRNPSGSHSLLSLFKQGVTRGIWLASPRYNLFNFFGDAEQTFLAHGAATAAENTIRSAMQQAMSLPGVGQGLALAGRSEAARNALSLAGDVVVSPGKVVPILKAMRQAGSLRGAMEAASKLSEVNRVMEGGDEVFRLGDRMVSGKKLREDAVKGGVFDSQPAAMAADEVEQGVRVLDEAAKLWQLPGRASNTLRDSVQDVVEGIGERQRVGLFVSLVRRGADPEEAAEGVVRALYDYRYSIAESERNVVMRWMMPWWAWQKNAYRQMSETLLSPMGTYKVKMMLTAPESAAEWASWYGEGRDVDPLGVRVGAMDQDRQAAYHRLVQYMGGQGLDPEQMRAALYEVAPLGSSNGGIESWPLMTPELVADWQAVAPYVVPPPGEADVRSYELGRPLVKVRPKDADVKKLWDSPSASTADYYAYLLPPSMAESYLGWAGAYAGVLNSAARTAAGDTGAKNVFSLAAEQVDPMRAPLAGLVLSTVAGKKVVVPVSNLVGQGLAYVGAADVLPAKNRAGQVLTPEAGADVASRGKGQLKYAITNPLLAAAWQSVGASVANLDAWQKDVEAAMRDPSWRTSLKLGFGLPSADVEPAGTPVSESYQVGAGMRVVPVADDPSSPNVPYARPPSTDLSYEGE